VTAFCIGGPRLRAEAAQKAASQGSLRSQVAMQGSVAFSNTKDKARSNSYKLKREAGIKAEDV